MHSIHWRKRRLKVIEEHTQKKKEKKKKEHMTEFPAKRVVRVTITGAAGQIGYSLCPLVARGAMLGPQQLVELRLLDVEQALKALDGLRAELQDCASPQLTDVVVTSDPAVAFAEADVIILCGAFPRKPGMERGDLLTINAKIFREQGSIIASVASPHCRILVVGNPANTNALLLSEAAKAKIDPRNVTALTRLDHNRALAQVAAKVGQPVDSVTNVVIWGNHSGTQVPDVNSAVAGTTSVRKLANDDQFFDTTFIQTVQQRGAEIMKLRGLSSAASAAKAIVDHVRDWIVGTPAGVFVSMAVISDGNPYGVRPGLMFSFPVTCRNGNWKIVEGLHWSPFVAGLIEKTTTELSEERMLALGEAA
jgi:malate dehydrogenase